MPEPIIPMLGDVELRTIQHITTLERRSLVEHPIPGMAGSAFQDMGRPATFINLSGILYGEQSRADLEKLRGKFQAAEPLSFAADITTATEITDVLIEDLRVVAVAGRPGTFVYQILLRESQPPSPAANPLATVNAGIASEAQGLLDQAVALTSVLDTLQNIPDIGNPTEPLTGMLEEFGSIIGGLSGVVGPLTDLFARP